MYIRTLASILKRLFLFFLSLIFLLPFQLADYESIMGEYPSDIILGETNTKCAAKEKAETVWKELYGERILQQKPYRVYFDEENDAWLVTGTLNAPFPRILTYWFMAGGVANIIIRKSDGKVLAVWHEE